MTPAEEYEFNKWLITLPPPVQVNILEACERGESYTKAAWSAAVAAERERCAKVCMDRAREAMNETGDYRLGRAYMDACVHCAEGMLK